ncbi:MAG: MmgE/PrpD family protein [Candidatus Helarchaeota archaeon]
MVTKAQNIGKFVKEIKYEKIPVSVINKAKEQVLGVLGAMYAGSQTNSAKILKKTTLENFGMGQEATVLPSGDKTSVENAIYINAASTIALDYVDYLFAGHTGVSSVNVSLALGEKYKISGKELLTNIIIGNEIAGRIGASVIVGPLNGQTLSFIHLGSSACIAAKILGLSADETANALGIAYTIPTSCVYRGFMGPMAKVLTAALPAKNGIYAAYLAKNGFTGALDIFENPMGWCNFNADLPLTDFIDVSLGEFWVTKTICYKIYPGCAYIDPMADCLLEIIQKNPDIDYRQVEKIDVSGTILMPTMDDLSRPFINLDEIKRTKSHVALNFSVPYNVAAILIDKELTPAQLSEEKILDPKYQELSKKVNLTMDIGLTAKTAGIASGLGGGGLDNLQLKAGDEEKFRMYFGGKVVVKMKDGKRYRAKTEEPLGTPGNPYPMEEKFKQEARSLKMNDNQISKVIDSVKKLDEMKDINELISILSIS